MRNGSRCQYLRPSGRSGFSPRHPVAGPYDIVFATRLIDSHRKFCRWRETVNLDGLADIPIMNIVTRADIPATLDAGPSKRYDYGDTALTRFHLTPKDAPHA